MSNTLQRFGIDPNGDPREQLPKLCGVLSAILNNPDLLVGANRSVIKFPAAKSGPASVTAANPALQFRVSSIREDTGTYYAKIVPGYVRNTDPDSGAAESVKDWMPTLGGTALDAATPPEITLETGKTIFCRVLTNAKGIVSATPTIVIDTAPQAGIHNQTQPENTTGELFFPIASIIIDGDGVTVTQHQQGGPIMANPRLPDHLNIGGKREVSKGRTSGGDTFDFRTLEQLEDGDGVPIIKPLDPGDPLEDPPIPAEEEGDTIPFRCIKKNNSGAVPYTITGDGAAVKFTFSGNDVTYADPFGGEIFFSAGLCTGINPPTSTGWWGRIDHIFNNFIAASSITMSEFYEGGILVNVTHTSGYISGTGTQADPGVVQFVTSDTDT